jgi:hypothetical protein
MELLTSLNPSWPILGLVEDNWIACSHVSTREVSVEVWEKNQ